MSITDPIYIIIIKLNFLDTNITYIPTKIVILI